MISRVVWRLGVVAVVVWSAAAGLLAVLSLVDQGFGLFLLVVLVAAVGAGCILALAALLAWAFQGAGPD